MYFKKRPKKRKRLNATPRTNPYDLKTLRRKLKVQRGRKNNLAQNDAKESKHYLRKIYFPSYARNRPSWSSNRRYDDYDDQYYDYVVPIDILPEDYYYWDEYDERQYNRRHYIPLERDYGYKGGGYTHQKPSYNGYKGGSYRRQKVSFDLFPLLALLGMVGLLFNLGLGKKIMYSKKGQYIKGLLL